MYYRCLASTHQTLVSTAWLCQAKMSPDIVRSPLSVCDGGEGWGRQRISPSENHWSNPSSSSC